MNNLPFDTSIFLNIGPIESLSFPLLHDDTDFYSFSSNNEKNNLAISQLAIRDLPRTYPRDNFSSTPLIDPNSTAHQTSMMQLNQNSFFYLNPEQLLKRKNEKTNLSSNKKTHVENSSSNFSFQSQLEINQAFSFNFSKNSQSLQDDASITTIQTPSIQNFPLTTRVQSNLLTSNPHEKISFEETTLSSVKKVTKLFNFPKPSLRWTKQNILKLVELRLYFSTSSWKKITKLINIIYETNFNNFQCKSKWFKFLSLNSHLQKHIDFFLSKETKDNKKTAYQLKLISEKNIKNLPIDTIVDALKLKKKKIWPTKAVKHLANMRLSSSFLTWSEIAEKINAVYLTTFDEIQCENKWASLIKNNPLLRAS